MIPHVFKAFNEFFKNFAKEKNSNLLFWEQISQFTFHVIIGFDVFKSNVWEITFTSKGCVYKQLS